MFVVYENATKTDEPKRKRLVFPREVSIRTKRYVYVTSQIVDVIVPIGGKVYADVEPLRVVDTPEANSLAMAGKLFK